MVRDLVGIPRAVNTQKIVKDILNQDEIGAITNLNEIIRTR
jgi:hypothetical protein